MLSGLLKPPRMLQPPCLKLLTASCSAAAEVAVICSMQDMHIRMQANTRHECTRTRTREYARHFTFTDALIKDDGKQLLQTGTERHRSANKSAILFLKSFGKEI